MDPIRPQELMTGARVADALTYATGVVGVLAGLLFFRDGLFGLAIVAWVLTFAAGVVLRLAAWGARALATLLVRTERMEDDLSRLGRDRGPWHQP
jgi:hypothetical protein